MKNATNIFLRIMIKVLKEWEDKKFKCFLMNQTFTSKHGHKHLHHTWNVFQRLRVVNLKQNQTKCCFVTKNIIFLSHMVCEVGTQHYPSKVKDIVEFLILKIVFNVTNCCTSIWTIKMKCGFEALLKVLIVVPNFIIGKLDFSKQLNVN
jgi:hypothetical protein